MGRQEQLGRLPALDGSSNPAADYSIDDITPNWSVSGSVDFTPSSRVFLSLRAGYFFNDFYNEGVYRGDRYVYQTSSLGFPGVPPGVPARASLRQRPHELTPWTGRRDRTWASSSTARSSSPRPASTS